MYFLYVLNFMHLKIIMLLPFNDRFIIFQHYRIPRESLLNRLSDVTLDGDYETAFTTPEQQLGKQSDNETVDSENSTDNLLFMLRPFSKC
jgi:hypothetical protein